MTITTEQVKTGIGHFNTAISAGVLDVPIGVLAEKVMAAERTKIAESVKKMYSTHISQVVSSRIHAAVMVKAGNAGSDFLERTVKGGENLLSATGTVYNLEHQSRFYKVRRRAADIGRGLARKQVTTVLTAPLSAIPDGGISKMAASGALSVIAKVNAIRRNCKLNGYTDKDKKEELVQQLGAHEAQRKSAKWSTKTLSTMGADLQRNLYKLKQSVRLLQERERNMKDRSGAASGAGQDIALIRKEIITLSMSFHESWHYINKISDMCTVLETVATEIKEHMNNMESLMEETKSTLMLQGDEFFR